MNKLFLEITESEVTPEGFLLIKKMQIIEGNTGESIKIAKINKHLKDFLHDLQIDVSKYLHFNDMKKKNQNLKLLCDKFKTYVL